MMQSADLIRMIELKYGALSPVLDERQRRQWAATEALAYGWGGITAVCEATGMSQDTVRKGITELAAREVDPEAPIDTRRREPCPSHRRLRSLVASRTGP
jgi:hypothetical protein